MFKKLYKLLYVILFLLILFLTICFGHKIIDKQILQNDHYGLMNK